MDFAEVHHKGPGLLRTDEDVLTSHVFGLLDFVRPGFVLAPWLNRAENLDGAPLALPPGAASLDMAFWHRLPGVDGDTETDLILTLGYQDGAAELLAVEVKYRCGPSEWPAAAELDPNVRGQLGREWGVTARLGPGQAPGCPSHLARRSLVYITPGASMPRPVLEAMSAEVEAKDPDGPPLRPALFWVSWLDLMPEVQAAFLRPDLEAHERRALLRLQDVLEARKLASMAAPVPPGTAQIAWSYGSEAYAWALSRIPRLGWRYHPPAPPSSLR